MTVIQIGRAWLPWRWRTSTLTRRYDRLYRASRRTRTAGQRSLVGLCHGLRDECRACSDVMAGLLQRGDCRVSYARFHTRGRRRVAAVLRVWDCRFGRLRRSGPTPCVVTSRRGPGRRGDRAVSQGRTLSVDAGGIAGPHHVRHRLASGLPNILAAGVRDSTT